MENVQSFVDLVCLRGGKRVASLLLAVAMMLGTVTLPGGMSLRAESGEEYGAAEEAVEGGGLPDAPVIGSGADEDENASAAGSGADENASANPGGSDAADEGGALAPPPPPGE